MNTTQLAKSGVVAALTALLVMNAAAQEVVGGRASVSASHTESVKKVKDDGMVWIDVVGKDTFNASITFNLDRAPADWSAVADDVSVTVGGIDCSPDITKSKAKGGSAKFKEKDKESKSSLTCTVKWSKNKVTVSLSGSNYDGDNIVAGDEDAAIDEDIDVSVDLGDISCDATVNVRGKGTVKIKRVKSGKGKDAEIEEYELFNWRASGSSKRLNVTR